MKKYIVKSDQFKDWSEREKNGKEKSEATQFRYFPPLSSTGTQVSPRFPNRALQKVRKSWLQVCNWPRPWPQILSLGKHAGTSSGNDLCSPGICKTRRSLSRESFGSPEISGRNLRDQSGAFEVAGRFLRACARNRLVCKSSGVCRSGGDWNFGSQYDSGFSLRRIRKGGRNR